MINPLDKFLEGLFFKEKKNEKKFINVNNHFVDIFWSHCLVNN